jgi:hypothetical protein
MVQLLNPLSFCSMFVLFLSYIMGMSLTCLKYMTICYSFLGLDICVYVPCAVNMFQLISMMLGHSWLTCQFVYSIAGQIGINFVPSLSAVCVLFFLDIHVNFWVAFQYIVNYVYSVSFLYISVHVFHIKETYSYISVKFDGL